MPATATISRKPTARQSTGQSRTELRSGSERGWGSALSDRSDLDDPDSLVSRLDKIMRLLKEHRNKVAARAAMKSLQAHPESSELMHLLAQAEAGVKWFPHFRDALVHVTLTGPSPAFTIGDVLTGMFSCMNE